MNATIYIPENELRDSIDYIWYHAEDRHVQRTVSIPFLHQELIFNLGCEFTIHAAGMTAHRYDHTGSLTGLFSEPLTTTISGRYEAMGILFKPHGIHSLLNIPAWQLTGPMRLPVSYSPPDTRAIQENRSPMQKIHSLEKFLLSVARPAPLPAAVNDFLYKTLSEPLRKGRIRQYLECKGHTSKQFLQAFKDTVGYTPQRLVQLIQINKAVRQIASDTDCPLTDVAYEQGFYDQAHFIRVFKKFAGMTPMQYKNTVKDGRVHNVFPNTIFGSGGNSVQF